MHLNEEDRKSDKRLLRRLRLALIVWIIVFIAALIWFVVTR
jgi:hypothetical protein